VFVRCQVSVRRQEGRLRMRESVQAGACLAAERDGSWSHSMPWWQACDDSGMNHSPATISSHVCNYGMPCEALSTDSHAALRCAMRKRCRASVGGRCLYQGAGARLQDPQVSVHASSAAQAHPGVGQARPTKTAAPPESCCCIQTRRATPKQLRSCPEIHVNA
jgi:hypothetical protein